MLFFHYLDNSFGGPVPSTNVTSVCECCGAIQVEGLYGAGHLSVDQLNAPPRPSGPPKLRVVKNGKKP